MNLQKLTIEMKVAQLLMFGFPGTTVTPFIRDFITKYNIGGIIHFARNIEKPHQLANLNRQLQELSSASPVQAKMLISIDQEGGTVTRMTEGAAVAPSNMNLGAGNNVEMTERVCDISGAELKAVGVNMNLAPVLDVNNNPENPVIGIRSFGENPELVAKLGQAAIKGYQKHVTAIAKHFPGHGDTALDSHLALPSITHARSRLNQVELLPFLEAIKANVSGIMTAHVYFPAIESKKGLPATLSYSVLTELLREELNYDGLVMTDCMEMKAISEGLGTVEAAIMTIEAGADMVLISHTAEVQQKAFEALVNAVKSGRISEERINQSCERILREKSRLGLLKPELPQDDPDIVGCLEHIETMKQAAIEGVTLVQDQGNIPLKGEKFLVIEPKGQAANIAEDILVDMGTLAYSLKNNGLEQVESREIAMDLTSLELEKIVDSAWQYSGVIVLTQDAHKNHSQAKLVQALLQQGVNVIGVGGRSPYELASFANIQTYIAAYDSRPLVLDSVAKVLLGKAKPQGELPVTISFQEA